VATFVLIPGAGGVAWYWHRVIPLLERAGHRAIAVDLPGEDERAGLPEYARLVLDAMGGRDDVWLVAQSMGAFTAALVAGEAPLRGLVFVNAMIPAPGETASEWWGNTGSKEAAREAAERGGYSTEYDLFTYFLHDVPLDVAAEGEGRERDEAEVAFASVCEFDGWPPIAIRAVAGADDRLFPAAFQQKLARDRLGIEADFLPGGHLIALSQPEALASYLVRQV
jgi:pimeloyl-ACP methyl ester carboxylesterase